MLHLLKKIGNGKTQFIESRTERCGTRYHGHSEPLGKTLEIHIDPSRLRFVTQVYAEQNGQPALHDLHGKYQVSLKAASITNADDRIRRTPLPHIIRTDTLRAAYIVSRDLLLGRVRLKGVCSRHIDEKHIADARGDRADRTGNGLAGPVPRVLTQPGTCVEYRTLADVRVSGKGNGVLFCIIHIYLNVRLRAELPREAGIGGSDLRRTPHPDPSQLMSHRKRCTSRPPHPLAAVL